MAVTGKRGVGIPTILLHDGEGTIVSIEMKTGETYRGLLDETEDNMNCVMKDAVRTDINGNTTQVEQIYLRGSQILFIVFPDIYPFHLLDQFRRYLMCMYCNNGSSGADPPVAAQSGSCLDLLGDICRYTCSFLFIYSTLKHAPMFKRVKMWKTHKGSIPTLGQGGVGGGAPRGQAAAIIRKGE